MKGARLVCVDRLSPTDPAVAALTASDPAVVVVASADGDEEVTTCGPGVVGILCSATRYRTSRTSRCARDRR